MGPRLRVAAAMLVAGRLLFAIALLSAQSPGPSAPRNFRGSANGSTITLSWEAPLYGAPIHYYIVDIGQQSGTYEASMPVGLLTTVSADVDDGVYYFRVRAVNAQGPGEASPEVAVAVGAGAGRPGAPQNLAAGMVPNLLTLTWDPPADGLPLTGYVLYAGTFPGTSNVLRMPIGSTTPTLNLPVGGVPGGTYFLRLTAVNAFGEGPPSNEVAIEFSNGPPSAPRNLVATLVNDVLTLTWEPPAVHPDGVTYTLVVSSSPGGAGIRVPMGSALSHTRSTAGAAPGTAHLRMVASNSFGEGPSSNEVMIVWGSAAPPGSPQSPTATLSQDTVNITWLPPATGAPILDYVVHISTSPGVSTFRRRTGGATSFSTPWAGAAPGTYWFFITAVNAFGEGAPSGNVSVTVGVGTPPEAPRLYFAEQANGLLTLQWSAYGSASAPLTGFVLYVGTSPGAANVLRQPLGLDMTYTAPVAGATPGIYYFRVAAVNMFGEGPQSNEMSVVIGPFCAIPAAPVLTGSAVSGTASLAWTTPTGGPVTGYTLFLAPGPGQPFTAFATVAAVNAISGPASPGTYLVRVAANAACGQGPPSNTLALTVP